MTSAKPLISTDDGSRERPLVITDAPDLLEDLLRLAAAAGAAVTVAPTAGAARRYWTSAPLVVVGADRAAALVAADLPGRSDVVLVGTDAGDRRTWSLALLINAEHVAFLPEAETWLVNLLSRTGGAARHRSLAVGVVGGRGGVGATTVAVALARAGLRRHVRSVLLEVDPLGGIAVGPDLPAVRVPGAGPLAPHQDGAFPAPASRLSQQPTGDAARRNRPRPSTDVAAVGGDGWPPPSWLDDDEAADRLLAAPIMTGDDLPVLSWDRDAMPVLPPTAVGGLFATARGTADLIVADLPRSTDPAGEIGLFLCQTVLVVVTTEPAATAAAARVAAHAARACSDVRLVVRMPPAGSGRRRDTRPRGTPGPARHAPTEALATAVAATIGYPLAGVIHDEPGVSPAAMAARVESTGSVGAGNGPTTGRFPDPPGSKATDETTGPRRAGPGSPRSGPRVGASLTRFGDRFLAELGIDGGGR